MKTRIGELLVRNSIITEEQLHEALDYQKKHKDKRVGEVLIELGYVSSKDLIWMLSEQADIPFVDIRPEMLDKQLIGTFPKDTLVNNAILPLYETETTIFVAVGDPTNVEVIQELRQYTSKEVTSSGADPVKIKHLLNQYFLSEEPETTMPADQEGTMRLTVTSNDALVQLVDSTGNVVKKRGPIEINIRIDKKKETGEQ